MSKVPANPPQSDPAHDPDATIFGSLPSGGDEGRPRIGSYSLLHRLGEGGMGDVWEAEQNEPVRRRVAVKIIKAGMDSKAVIARFEAERQALALMDHPAIAKVLDAGQTPRGRPFFVMEFVRGVSIDRYCDDRKLSTEERIMLFCRVCDGVQHAHQKAIIHRDLKPSNILVARSDDEPQPRIIDFGVAKAMAQPLTERTMYTEHGMLLGTPDYMSPEQADLASDDVDTRSDVYSLGVVLYVLLAGMLPFDQETLRADGLEAMRRRIREEDPPRPSTRMTALGARAVDIASRRRAEPAELRRTLAGDLDWIVMKALAKERERRYGSPRELADDLRRFLDHVPVTARSPSVRYRAGKFVRRHRAGVAVSMVGVAMLLAFAATMAVQAGRIAAERDRANIEATRANREAMAKGQVSEFLKDLFRVSDPGEARGNSITARELLDTGAQKIEAMLPSQPDIAAELMDTMGEVYRRLGLFPQAEALFERALAERKAVLGEDHPDTLRSVHSLAGLYSVQGRYDEAESLFLETLEDRTRLLGDDHVDTLSSVHDLAALYRKQRRYADAEPLYDEVLAARRRMLGEDHPDTLESMYSLAILYRGQARYEEAERTLVATLEARRRVLGDDHPQTLRSINGLANLYANQEKYAEAEPLFLEILQHTRRVLGEEHPDTLSYMNNLASVYAEQGRYADAEPLYVETLETRRRVLGNEHPMTGRTLYNLASLHVNNSEPDKAMSALRQAVDAGFAEHAWMVEDTDFAPLHGVEFDRLVERARRNAARQRAR